MHKCHERLELLFYFPLQSFIFYMKVLTKKKSPQDDASLPRYLPTKLWLRFAFLLFLFLLLLIHPLWVIICVTQCANIVCSAELNLRPLICGGRRSRNELKSHLFGGWFVENRDKTFISSRNRRKTISKRCDGRPQDDASNHSRSRA